MSGRKRILHLHGSADVGGTELRAFQVVCQLKHEYDFGILFFSRAGGIIDRYRSEGIPNWQVRFPAVAQALSTISKFKPDVVHMYGLEVNILFRPLLYALGYRRLIGYIGGLSNTEERPPMIRILSDRMTYRLLERYVVNSAVVADQMARFGFVRNRLHVLHNGIDVPATAVERQEKATPVIVSVGNLRQVKGHPFLISALHRLAQQHVPFQARIVGDGPDRKALAAQATQLGIADRIEFTGPLKHSALQEVLANSDIFALMSLSEGISGAAMEAMATGLPVVATDVGGMRELVSHEIDGFLVSSRDSEHAADFLRTLLVQRDLRVRMGKAAHLKVLREFNLVNTADGYRAIYG
jgi:glycosyltransferase involved in cell wall biosynthesis